MRTYLKDSNSKKVYIYMVDSTDHATPKTGATVSVKVSKNGGAFGAGGGSVAELEEGVYAYTPSAGDVDTLGPIAFKATASGCDPFIVEGLIAAYDPYDSVRMGQTALPNAAAGSNGGLPTTNGTKLNQTADLTAGQSIGISGDLSATMKTSVQTAADAAVTANTKIVAIEADTNELQTNQGNWLTATGFSTLTAQQVWEYATRILTAGTNIGFPDASSIATAVWSAGTRTLTSLGTLVADTAAAVWAYATRILTGNDNLSIPTAEQIGVAVMTTPTSGTDAGDLGYIIEAGYTLMSTGDGVKVGSIANNAITSNAVAAAALNGKGDWNMVAPDNTSIALLVKLCQADVKLDTTTTPWTEKYYEAGTATLLLTKVLYDENGDGISSIDSYIGQRMAS